jgi:hypothetical protein
MKLAGLGFRLAEAVLHPVAKRPPVIGILLDFWKHAAAGLLAVFAGTVTNTHPFVNGDEAIVKIGHVVRVFFKHRDPLVSLIGPPIGDQQEVAPGCLKGCGICVDAVG